MAIEPKTVRETNIVVQGVVDRLDLVQKMTWGVIALLGTLIAGAAALYIQIGDVRTDVAVLKSTLGVMKDQQSAIQESLRSLETKSQASLSRIENKLASNQVPDTPEPPLNLADSEIDFLRTAMKIFRTGKPVAAKAGDQVPDGATKPLPANIIDKIPRLQNYGYTYDQSGAVLIVSSRTRRIVEIIEPA
jgi:hypothetical protein